VTDAVGYVSDVTAQNTFRISALECSNRLKVCEGFEEKEGWINTDLLNRLIIVGGPLIQPGQSMQDQLMKQVKFLHWSYLFLSYQVPKSPNSHGSLTVLILYKTIRAYLSFELFLDREGSPIICSFRVD
jgi:hypothetical protein